MKNLTILGLDTSENFDLEETNFNKLMVKIRGMSLFWAKFKLSIVGRINIALAWYQQEDGEVERREGAAGVWERRVTGLDACCAC